MTGPLKHSDGNICLLVWISDTQITIFVRKTQSAQDLASRATKKNKTHFYINLNPTN